MSALYCGRWVGLNSSLPASLKMIAISSTRRSTPMRSGFGGLDCATAVADVTTSANVSATARNVIIPRWELWLVLPPRAHFFSLDHHRRQSARDVHAHQTECPTQYGGETRRLTEYQPAHRNRNRRHKIGGQSESTRRAARERVGPRRERDRCREDPKEEQPRDASGWRDPELADQGWRKRQTHECPDGAADPGGLQRGDTVERRLLCNHANCRGERGDETEDHADERGLARRCRESDHYDAREGKSAPKQQIRCRALLQECGREGDDENRRNENQHRRRSRIDASFGVVEHHIVDAEPAQTGDDAQQQLTAGRPHDRSREGQRAEEETAERQAAEREGAGRERAARGADADERRRP